MEEESDPREAFLKKVSLDAEAFEEYEAAGIIPKKNTSLVKTKLKEWRYIYFQPLTRGSVRTSILCLLCVTIGVGILSIPYVIMNVGIVLGLIIFMVCAAATQWTLTLVTMTSAKDNIYDYSELVQKYYGSKLLLLTEIMSLVNNMGGIIALNKFSKLHLKIALNFVMSILDYVGHGEFFINTFYTEVFTSLSVVVFLQLPACTHSYISQMHILSALGTLSLLYVVLVNTRNLIKVSIFEFPKYYHRNFSFEKINYFNTDADIIQTFCVFFFAFGNHTSLFNVLTELSNKTTKRLYMLINYSFIAEVTLYVIVMFIGYFSTLDKTNEVFIDREDQSIFMVIGKVFYLICLVCNTGLYYFMIRPSLEWFMLGDRQFSDTGNIIVALTMLLTLLAISTVFSKITVILSLIGSTAQVYLMFVVPVLVYIKAYNVSFTKTCIYLTVLAIIVTIGWYYFFMIVFQEAILFWKLLI